MNDLFVLHESLQWVAVVILALTVSILRGELEQEKKRRSWYPIKKKKSSKRKEGW